jgi:2'-5' RNA ligase
MGTDSSQNNDQLQEFLSAGSLSLKQNGAIPDEVLVKELEQPGSDQRGGVNLICRPEEQILEHIQSIQAYLRMHEPLQYYYPRSDLHLTLFEICHSRTLDQASKIARRVNSQIGAILADEPAPTVCSPVLGFDSKGCRLYFVPADDHLQILRFHIQQKLSQGGAFLGSRYVSLSAHVTLMRYVSPLKGHIENWIRVLESAPSNPKIAWLLSPVWLTWGATWYGIRSRVHESGPYKLHL